MVCKLQKCIYGLKRANRIWNIRFDQAVKSFGITQNSDEPCVYKKSEGKIIAFLVLYMANILLIGNDVGDVINCQVMVSQYFQYEGSRRGELYPKDKALLGSEVKDSGIIPCLYRESIV